MLKMSMSASCNLMHAIMEALASTLSVVIHVSVSMVGLEMTAVRTSMTVQ